MWLVAGEWLGKIDDLQRMEEWFGADEPEVLIGRYEDALTALRDGDVDAWLEHSTRAGLTEEAFRHFKEDWLNAPSVTSCDRDSMERRFRDAFTAAMEDAREYGLKTNYVVVALDEDPSAFDIGHVVGANAVTVVISLPKATVRAI